MEADNEELAHLQWKGDGEWWAWLLAFLRCPSLNEGSRKKKQEEEGTHLFSRLPSSPGVMATHQQGRLLFHGLLNANAVTHPSFQFWWAGSIYARLKVWSGLGQEIERDEIEKGWAVAGTVVYMDCWASKSSPRPSSHRQASIEPLQSTHLFSPWMTASQHMHSKLPVSFVPHAFSFWFQTLKLLSCGGLSSVTSNTFMDEIKKRSPAPPEGKALSESESSLRLRSKHLFVFQYTGLKKTD